MTCCKRNSQTSLLCPERNVDSVDNKDEGNKFANDKMFGWCTRLNGWNATCRLQYQRNHRSLHSYCDCSRSLLPLFVWGIQTFLFLIWFLSDMKAKTLSSIMNAKNLGDDNKSVELDYQEKITLFFHQAAKEFCKLWKIDE